MLKILAMIGMITTNSSYATPSALDPAQMYCVAKAIYSEARGEAIEGQIAVAWGIKHRSKSKDFPNQPCDIIYDERHAIQFPHIKDVRIDENSPEWDSAVEVALLVWVGFIEDPIEGRRFWYAPNKVSKPSWLKMGAMKKIGNHIFYDKADS